MSKKHLTLSDRIVIQTGLKQNLSLAKIAEKVGVFRSTIRRGIKACRKVSRPKREKSGPVLRVDRKWILSSFIKAGK